MTTLIVVAVARERLVDRVVEHLEHHVVEAGAVGGVADVHAGTLAHRVEALQDLDAGRIVVVAVVRRTWNLLGSSLLSFDCKAAQSTGADSEVGAARCSCSSDAPHQIRIGITTYL